MIDLVIDLLLLIQLLLALYGLGRALRRYVRLPFWSQAADLAYTFAFGLGAAVTLLFGAALAGWLRPAAGWALLAAGLLLTAAHYRALVADLGAVWESARDALAASWFVRAAALLAAAFVLTNLIADLAPPTEGDTVHQYLLVPRYWVAAGRYVQPAHIWASTLPGNMMMLSAWALLLRGSYSLASLITGFGMGLLLALGVYALARLHFGRGVAGLAAAAIYTMPDTTYLVQSAKVDMGWAFFEALALAAFFRWLGLTPYDAGHERLHDGANPTVWLILSGVCLGLAAGSKNQTWISIGLLSMWLTLRMALRRDGRGLLRAGPAFGLAALAAALPYYLYNGIAHHNPFYPVFANPFHAWFGGTASPRSELGTEVFYPWTVGGYLTNLWNASLGHTNPRFYLGFIAGPIFLLTIPVGLVLGLFRGRRVVWGMLGYAFIFSVAWFLVKQAVRHFLPGLIPLSVTAGLVLWQLTLRPTWPSRAILGITLIILTWNFLIGWGVLYWNGAYRVALGLESREQYLQRFQNEVIEERFPDWETIEMLNGRLEPSDRVLAEFGSSPLFIEPELISPNWGDRERLDEIADPEALLDRLVALHIGHILVYKRVDSGLIFAQPEFLANHGELVYDGQRTQLYRIVWPDGDG